MIDKKGGEVKMTFIKRLISISSVALMLSVPDALLAADQIVVSLVVETQRVYRLEPLDVAFVITNVSSTNVVLPTSFLGYDIQYQSDGVVKTGGHRTVAYVEGPGKESINIPARGIWKERVPLSTVIELGLGTDQLVGDFRVQAVIEVDGKWWSAWETETETNRSGCIYSPCWSGRVCSAWIDLTVLPIEDADDKALIEVLYGKRDAAKTAGIGIWYRSGKEDRRLYQEAAEKYPRSLFAKYCDFYAAAQCKSWDWEDAIRHYRNVIEKYPVFRFTDDAKLRLAKVYLDYAYKDPAGTRAKALQLLESIVKDHPQSDSVTEARELLKKLAAIPISTGATNGVLRK